MILMKISFPCKFLDRWKTKHVQTFNSLKIIILKIKNYNFMSLFVP